jgi:hypothetical protein
MQTALRERLDVDTENVDREHTAPNRSLTKSETWLTHIPIVGIRLTLGGSRAGYESLRLFETLQTTTAARA